MTSNAREFAEKLSTEGKTFAGMSVSRLEQIIESRDAEIVLEASKARQSLNDVACQRAYRNGLISMRVAVQASLDGMPHVHNPDVQKKYQRNYCWRCLLEEVLKNTVAEAALHSADAKE